MVHVLWVTRAWVYPCHHHLKILTKPKAAAVSVQKTLCWHLNVSATMLGGRCPHCTCPVLALPICKPFLYQWKIPPGSWRALRPVVTRARAGCRERQPGAGRPRTPVDGCVPFKVGVCVGARSEDRASRQLKAGALAEGGNAASSACALVGEGRTCQRAVRGLSVGARPVEPELPLYCLSTSGLTPYFMVRSSPARLPAPGENLSIRWRYKMHHPRLNYSEGSHSPIHAFALQCGEDISQTLWHSAKIFQPLISIL